MNIKTEELIAVLEKNGCPLKKTQLYSLARAGQYPEPSRGEWDLEKVLTGLIRYYRERDEKRAVSLLDEKRAEKLDNENALLVRKREKEDKLWCRVEDVHQGWQFVAATLKARITSFDMPAKLKTSLLETLAQQPDHTTVRVSAVENEPVRPK